MAREWARLIFTQRWQPVGVYVSIRGWVECDETQRDIIRTIVESDSDPYGRGWTFSDGPGWQRYVFYGADIRESGVDWFLGQLRKIAAVPASDVDNDRVRGLFLASHEMTGMAEWQIRHGAVVTSAAAGYEYLDQ